MDFLEIGGVSLIVAFIAGLLSVASPCVLPLIPAYLGYLTGAALEPVPEAQAVAVSQSDPGGGAAMAMGGGQPPLASVPSPFLHSLAFVTGFTAIFVAFGVSLGLIGFFLKDHQDTVLKVSGTLLIIMGLHLSGVITIPFLEREARMNVGAGQKVGYARSFLVGAAFSAGWSPCIGPTLGAIFALAVSSGTVAEAGLLLLVYSAGLSVPFVAMGLAYNGVKPMYNRIKRYIGVVNYLSCALLIIVGILIFTNSLINMNELFNFGFLPDVSNA